MRMQASHLVRSSFIFIYTKAIMYFPIVLKQSLGFALCIFFFHEQEHLIELHSVCAVANFV